MEAKKESGVLHPKAFDRMESTIALVAIGQAVMTAQMQSLAMKELEKLRQDDASQYAHRIEHLEQSVRDARQAAQYADAALSEERERHGRTQTHLDEFQGQVAAASTRILEMEKLANASEDLKARVEELLKERASARYGPAKPIVCLNCKEHQGELNLAAALWHHNGAAHSDALGAAVFHFEEANGPISSEHPFGWKP